MSLENSKSEKTEKTREWGKEEELYKEKSAKIIRGPDGHLSLRNDENSVINSILGPHAKHVYTGEG